MNRSSSPSPSILGRVVFLVSTSFFILNLLLPVYGKDIGASVVEIGLFFSAFSVVTLVTRPMVGWGLDRFGRRLFFLAGVAGYALTMFIFALMDQVWSVVLARGFQGISSSLMWISVSAMIADMAGEDRRGIAFGRIAQSSNRGGIAGTFLGFFLINADLSINGQVTQLGSWTLLFLAYGGINLFALYLAFRHLPETSPNSIQISSQPIRWSKTWILLLLVTLVTGGAAAMVSPILIIFLQEKLGVGVELLSIAFLPSALVWALFPAQLGKLADRFGRKPLMLIGLGAAAASSFLLPFLGSVIALALLWAFQAMCYAASDPAEQALVADLTGREQRGRAYGLYLMFADLGAAIGPFGGAWLYQAFGPAMPFYTNGVILALCAFILLFLLKIPSPTRKTAQAIPLE